MTDSLNTALRGYLFEQGIRFVDYGESIGDEDVDLIRQTNVLLDAIELSQVRKTIGGDRDYLLGTDERNRLSARGADYALLIFLRASRASGGRRAVAILAS
ncbi:MAG: hypothetical protein VB949_02690, partial [Pseudomonadales bacterium]